MAGDGAVDVSQSASVSMQQYPYITTYGLLCTFQMLLYLLIHLVPPDPSTGQYAYVRKGE